MAMSSASSFSYFVSITQLDAGIDPNVDNARTPAVQALAKGNEIIVLQPHPAQLKIWEEEILRQSQQDDKTLPPPSQSLYVFGNNVITRGLCDMTLATSTGLYFPYSSGIEIVARFSVPILRHQPDIRLMIIQEATKYSFSQSMKVRQAIETDDGVYCTEIVVTQQHPLWGSFQLFQHSEYYDPTTQSFRTTILCTPFGAIPDKKDCLGDPQFTHQREFTIVESADSKVTHYPIKLIAARILTHKQSQQITKDEKQLASAKALALQFKQDGSFGLSDAPAPLPATQKELPAPTPPASAAVASPLSSDLRANREKTYQTFAEILMVININENPAQPVFLYAHRKDKNRIGMGTAFLSNPDSKNVGMGVGYEILAEMSRPQARIANAQGQITLASVSNSVLFAMVKVFSVQHTYNIRQALQEYKLVNTYIPGIDLPPEFQSSKAGYCNLLLEHSKDPTLPHDFKASVFDGTQWTLQSIPFISARLLTLTQDNFLYSLDSTKNVSRAARQKLADSFTADGSFDVSKIPHDLLVSWDTFFNKKQLFPLLPDGAPSADIMATRANFCNNYVDEKERIPFAPSPASMAADAKANPTWTWPHAAQKYYVYVNRHDRNRIGLGTLGLSTPFQHTQLFHIGIGFELILEMHRTAARIADAHGQVTSDSIHNSVQYAITKLFAQRAHKLGIHVRELLEKFPLHIIELSDIDLPPEFLDPDTRRCALLLGHLGDPALPTGVNVSIFYKNQWIPQTIMYYPARLLTPTEIKIVKDIRKLDSKKGAAETALAERFKRAKSFSVTEIPDEHLASWNAFFSARKLFPLASNAPLALSQTSVPSATPAPAPAKQEMPNEKQPVPPAQAAAVASQHHASLFPERIEQKLLNRVVEKIQKEEKNQEAAVIELINVIKVFFGFDEVDLYNDGYALENLVAKAAGSTLEQTDPRPYAELKQQGLSKETYFSVVFDQVSQKAKVVLHLYVSAQEHTDQIYAKYYQAVGIALKQPTYSAVKLNVIVQPIEFDLEKFFLVVMPQLLAFKQQMNLAQAAKSGPSMSPASPSS